MLTKISAQTLGSAAASITFSSIPATYRHLYVVFYGRSTDGNVSNNVLLQFNSDSTATYDYQYLYAYSTLVGAGEGLAGTSVVIAPMSAAGAPASVASGGGIYIFDYARTNWQKSLFATANNKQGTATENIRVWNRAGFWRNTAAVTTITLLSQGASFAADTTAVLYGMGASGGTDVIGETVLSVDTASITFSSIPATSKHLRVVAFGRSNNAALTTAFYADLNGDTAANYDWQRLAGTASTASAVESLATSAMEAATLTGDTATANVASGAVITVYDYARTSWQKSVSALSATKWGTASGQVRVQANSGFWRNTAAITSITLYPGSGSLKSGSLATLYGFD